MASVTTNPPPLTFIHQVGAATLSLVEALGDLVLFFLQMLRWLCVRLPRGSVLWPTLYEIGVLSVPVILVTGLFIGMVLAVQSYDTLRIMHFESRLGAVVNVTLVKELGPVLAATMLAGRVGSAIAAEIGTMKVTEQIDALRALGADPIAYLVVPRFLACVCLIPALTVIADVVGIFGGWMVSVPLLGISNHFFWHYSDGFITAFDFVTGVLKSVLFGGCIAVISCHRGFHCTNGAEGVGRAATQAFVYSFIAILAVDFFSGMVLIRMYWWLFPAPVSLL